MRAGYSKEDLGLDAGCRSPSLSYYVPCLNRQHPDYAFFCSFGISPRGFDRYAKPAGLRTDLAGRGSEAPLVHSIRARKELTEERKNELQDTKFELMSMKEGRHQLLFKFAGMLENLGFPLHEIEAELSEVAGRDAKLIKKKNDMMKRLKRNRYS